MAKGYLTFKGTTTGIVDAFYPEQTLADAGASEADITAVQGIHDIPDDYRPNKAYWDGTDLLPEIPESVVSRCFVELRTRSKNAGRICSVYLENTKR